ncbi:MAG: hypothetical protein ACRCXX_03630 [Cetobacterium sp.]|uniref:hypothetical protein n=1 Tax=Cetobacterium sp. TaxID=2071632 RepID=UPI003F3B2638
MSKFREKLEYEMIAVGAMKDVKVTAELVKTLKGMTQEELEAMETTDILAMLPQALHQPLVRMTKDALTAAVKDHSIPREQLNMDAFLRVVLFEFIETMKESSLEMEEEIEKIQKDIADHSATLANIEVNHFRERRALKIKSYEEFISNDKKKSVGELLKAKKALMYIRGINTHECIPELLDKKFQTLIKGFLNGASIKDTMDKITVDFRNWANASRRPIIDVIYAPSVILKMLGGGEEDYDTVYYFWFGFINAVYNRKLTDEVYLYLSEVSFEWDLVLKGKATPEEVEEMAKVIRHISAQVKEHVEKLKTL